MAEESRLDTKLARGEILRRRTAPPQNDNVVKSWLSARWRDRLSGGSVLQRKFFADEKTAGSRETARIGSFTQAGVRRKMHTGSSLPTADMPVPQRPKEPIQQAEAHVAKIALVRGGKKDLRSGGCGR